MYTYCGTRDNKFTNANFNILPYKFRSLSWLPNVFAKLNTMPHSNAQNFSQNNKWTSL